jgi:hypothetical protein
LHFGHASKLASIRSNDGLRCCGIGVEFKSRDDFRQGSGSSDLPEVLISAATVPLLGARQKQRVAIVFQSRQTERMASEFSKRHGFKTAPKHLVRDAAPEELRRALLAVFERFGYGAQDIGEWICYLMREIPSEQLGAEPGWYVVGLRMDRLPWYRVFDLVEKVCPAGIRFASLAKDINECFEEYGIAWKLVDGEVQERGDEIHEGLVQDATAALTSTGRMTAAAELKKAVQALSTRPDADTRGAVIRAVGAVEALSLDVLGDSNATLGPTRQKAEFTAASG